MSIIANLLYSIFVLFITILIWDIYERFQPFYKSSCKIPGETRFPIIGSLRDTVNINQENAIPWLDNKVKKFKGFFSVWFLGFQTVNLVRAHEFEAILSSTKYTDKSIIYRFLHSFLKTGLLTSNGEKWLKRRRILTPTFHFNILQQFVGVFNEQSDLLVMGIENDIVNGTVPDLKEIISRFTLNTISETAMGYKQNSTQISDAYRQKLYEFGEMVVHRLIRPWLYTNVAYQLLGYQNRLNKLLQPVHDYTMKIISKRRSEFMRMSTDLGCDEIENIYETKKVRYAMLDTLLAAEADGKIDSEGVQEEVDTFTFEGHDTTSGGLVYAILLLAQHAAVQDRIYNEIMNMFEHTQKIEFTMSNLSNLSYLDRVIKESLRLYPPVMFISRQIPEEVIIDNIVFPPKTTFHMHIYHLHRDPKYFPDPEKFDPDRFLPHNMEDRHPYAYIPFSAGPRNCIGQKFANLEMKSVLAKLILKFKILPVTKREDLILMADLVLRNKFPIEVKFQSRLQ